MGLRERQRLCDPHRPLAAEPLGADDDTERMVNTRNCPETCTGALSERKAMVDDSMGGEDCAKQHDCALKCPFGQSASPLATPLMECVQSKGSTSSLSASAPSVDGDAATCKETHQCATDKCASSVDACLGPGQVPKLPPRLGLDQPGCRRPPAEKAEKAENADSEADDDTKAVVLTLPGEEHANRSREALLATYQGYRAFVLTARSFGRWGLATFGDGATDP